MTALDYIKYIYIDAPLIAKVALILAAIFMYTATICLLLSVFSRVDQLAYNRRKTRLLKIYQRRLTEMLFEENGEDDSRKLERVKKRYLKDEESKEIMIGILLEQQRNFTGELNGRIKYFYEALELHKISITKIFSKKWHLIAIGIRELGLLGNKKSIEHIKPFTNHKYLIIRREAQMALVRQQGLDGLSFLDTLTYQLSEWHQLNLFETLAKVETKEKPKLAKYLDSNNVSVICFALKIVGFFKLMDTPEKLIELLHHEEREVRMVAVQTIARLEFYHLSEQLLEYYPSQPIEVKVEILKAFSEIGMPNLSDFLMQEFKSTQFEISLHAAKAIQAINPNLLLDYKLETEDLYQHNQIKMQLIH